ncbi:Dipeptidyl aminopeptidase/acylaminoacyl peptidase [Rhizobiales bacterium GAS191]|nr:Dipeptidyl aminopeptidase/acylaminoacyl peptidase [Rhizobiales bacterium GAS191]
MSHVIIPRLHLFGNPSKAQAQISPDGQRLSWLAPVNGVLNLWVAPFGAPQDAYPVTDDRHRGVRMYGWTYDGRHLVYLQDEGGDEKFHVYAVEPDSRVTRDLTPFPGVTAGVARISRVVRDRILVALNSRDARFHDLHSIDIASGEMTLVEENPGFAHFITDDRYKVHLAVKTTPDGGRDILRRDPGRGWAPWIRFEPEDARVSFPDHLDRASQTLFLRDSRGRETAALIRMDLATGGTTLLASHDKADIGGLLNDQDTLEPLIYSVLTDRLQYVALDPRIQADLDFLNGQDIGDWYVQSRTEADDRWIVAAASDTRPGIAYVYDRPARSLRELHHSRPELAGAPLAAMKPVTIKSRDGLDLVSYLTVPKGAAQGSAPQGNPLPMVLLVHGGPWGRDQFGFHPQHQWLANRGYAVLSVNFRGSTGFGKSFVNAGDREWGRRMDDDLLDAVAWAIDEKIADPRRIAIMGWSYGGYATLVGLTRNPDVYACGVDVVGPSNLETLMRTIPPYWESIRAQFYKAVGDPDTEDGLRLAKERSPLFQAHRITKPLLIAQGANDQRVKQAESDQMVDALKANGIPVTYLLFPDEGHGFARPENSIAFYAVAEAFLARHLGGHAEATRPEELSAATMQVVEGAPASFGHKA